MLIYNYKIIYTVNKVNNGVIAKSTLLSTCSPRKPWTTTQSHTCMYNDKVFSSSLVKLTNTWLPSYFKDLGNQKRNCKSLLSSCVHLSSKQIVTLQREETKGPGSNEI